MYAKADAVPIPTIAVEPIPVTIDEDEAEDAEYRLSAYGSIEAEATSLIVIDDNIDISKETNRIIFLRDPAFAILFLLHFGVIIWLAISYGNFHIDEIDFNVTTWKDYVDDDATSQMDDNKWSELQKIVDETIQWVDVYPPRIICFIIIPSCLIAYGFSFLITALAIPACPTGAVVFSLLGTLAMTLIVSFSISVAAHFNVFVFMISAFFVGIVIYYICVAWRVIPFAAVNLSVALRGISENCGVYLVAFIFSITGFFWTISWFYILFGVMDSMDKAYETVHRQQGGTPNSDNAEDQKSDPIQGIVFLALLVSLYWTSKILLNVVQVSVAGVMATWCFVKNDAEGCCSPGVYSSLFRSVTFSFGSICMGSLFEAIVTMIRVLLQSTRDQSNRNSCEGCGPIIFCLLECIAKCLEDILDYFNQWTWVYIGIYGYSYLESGRKVVELFKARGFTTFITNDLIYHVLRFTNVIVGILTGIVAILVQSQVDKSHTTDDNMSYLYGSIESSPPPAALSMGLGFFVGISISCVMMQVVKSAVNTLIVCFADDPHKFEENRPQVTTRIAEAWGKAFPHSGLDTRTSYSVDV